ncbi:MAG TPA: SRPBCC domain-containing protein [Candidatus Saccharimonadales bacterium]|jgi:uncharacterized protein YndB with AHSA1/START domain
MADVKVEAPENSQNIIMHVTVNAPLSKVYQAYSDPALLRQWWAAGEPVTIDYFEAGEGGKWRFLTAGEDGRAEDNFRGCIHTVMPEKLLIQTFEWEGMPGYVALEAAAFEDQGDTTQVTITQTHQSVQARDGMVGSGMEGGFRKSIDALERLINEA